MASRGKRLLIVDGYNVLRCGSRYARIEFPDYTHDTYNAARERLLNDVAAFAGRDMDAVIVFDGKGNDESDGHVQQIGNVKVIFSPAGQLADHVIERLAHDAREDGRTALVVTSDSTIQDTVFGHGVDRMSAEGFCLEMKVYAHDEVEQEAEETAQKNTVAERVSPTTVEELKNLRDSLSG